jgi:hypothetical protein
VEKPDVDCTTTFMREFFYTLFSTGDFYPTAMGDLGKDIETTLAAQAPSHLVSAPPPNTHFCFPGSSDPVLDFDFRNGGLSVCFE